MYPRSMFDEAVLTCTRDRYFEQKLKHHNFSSENYHFTAEKIALLSHGRVTVMRSRTICILSSFFSDCEPRY